MLGKGLNIPKGAALIFVAGFLTVLLLSSAALASQNRFNVTLHTSTLNISTPNQYFNITVGNNLTIPGQSINITHVEITLFTYSGFSYVNHSNATAAAFTGDVNFNRSANTSFTVTKEFATATTRLTWSNITLDSTQVASIIPVNLQRNFTIRLGTPLQQTPAAITVNVTHLNGSTYLYEQEFLTVALQQTAINARVELRGPANNTNFSSNNVPIQFNVTGDSLNYACLVFNNQTSFFGQEFVPASAPPNFTVPNATNTNITIFMPSGWSNWNVKCSPKKAYVAIRTGAGWNVTVNGTGESSSLNSFKVGDFINFTNDRAQSIRITFSPPFFPQYIVDLTGNTGNNNSILIDTAPDFANIIAPRPPLVGPFVDNASDSFSSNVLGGFGNFGDPRFAPGVFAPSNFTLNVSGFAKVFIDPGFFFNPGAGGFKFDHGPCATSTDPKPSFCFPNASGGVNFDANNVKFFEERPDFFMHGFTDCTDPTNANKPDCKLILDPTATITGDTSSPNLLFTKVGGFSDRLFVDFGTDEMTNMTLDFYGTNSYCGSAIITLIDDGVYNSGTLLQNSRFKPFHHFELSSVIASNISISSNSTYYYKSNVCDKSGNCVASSCKNFNSTTGSFASTPVPINFTIPSGFNFKFRFQNGTEASVGSTTNFANMANMTMKFQPANANWGIDLPASAIATASSFDFTKAFKTVDSGGRTFVGMNKTVWDSLAQRLGITSINMTIIGTSDTLFKCDDSGTNCKDVSSLAVKMATNTTAGTSTWTIPVTLGFSTYVDNPTAVATAAAAASGGGGGSGGSSGSTVVSKFTKSFTSLTPSTARIITPGELAYANTSVDLISILVNELVVNVKVTTEKLSSKPATVATEASGVVLEYLNIENTNLPDEKITEAKVRFNVPLSWVNKNDIDVSTIALNRFSGGAWSKLPTVQLEATSTTIIFEATTPGFSTFAVTGESLAAAPVEEKPAAPAEEKPTEEVAAPAAPTYAETPSSTLMIVGIVVVIIVIAAVFIFKRRK